MFVLHFRVLIAVPDGNPSLDINQELQIDVWLRTAANQLITEKFGRLIFGEDAHCLDSDISGNYTDLWLNNNVINHRMELLVHQLSGNMKVYYIPCEFWREFRQFGYNVAKPFTQKISLFNSDMVLLPLIENDHWSLAVMYPKQKRIQLYDSSQRVASTDDYVFDKLDEFLRAECESRLNATLDTSYWMRECVNYIPKQSNGFDCGVFLCVFAEYALRNWLDFNFSQMHMTYFRKKMLYEMCTGHLLN